jgi:signal transduction histidine kinase
VAAHVVAQTASEAEQADVAVLDETSEAATTGDALLLERLVHNLVENGIRHNVDAGGWVHLATRADDGTVEIEVANTGPAVSAYEIPALFEPFHRDDNRLVGAKGAGLGLSIVAAIARVHGGTATATPRTGGGLVATVTLPTPRTPALSP